MKKVFALAMGIFCACSMVACKPNTHTFEGALTHDDTYHWYACEDEDCEEVSQKEVHDWDEGVMTALPSVDQPGVKTFVCKDCGRMKAEAVAYVPSYQVSPQGWIASFNASLLNDVTLTGYIVTSTYNRVDMVIKVDENGNSYQHMKFSETDQLDSYYEKTGDTYTHYMRRCTWMDWRKTEAYDYGYNAEFFLAILPLYDKYTEFTFNPDTNCYEAGQMDCESIAFGTLKYESVTLQYIDGKAVSVLAKMRESFQPDPHGGVYIEEYCFDLSDYGTTEVVLPQL